MDAQSSKAPRPDQMMDYDAILSTQRELTPANLQSAADLIETSMGQVPIKLNT